ncbi:MAG: GrpB family protein [Caldilineaceae bacterium]
MDRPIDALFQQSYQELLTALGPLTQGGVVNLAAHIGATAVAALAAHSPLDLLLVVEPFPLTGAHVAQLQALGYQPQPAAWSEAQFFQHQDGRRLYVHSWADPAWNDHLLLRDYLRSHAPARARYLAAKAGAVGSRDEHGWKATLLPELIQEAHGWWIAHDNFATLHTLVADLAAFPHPWYISSGWALDLFLGEVTRHHEDVDIIVDRQDQLAVQQHMRDRQWQWLTPLDGKLEPWPPHMRLELPRHQAHAHRVHEHGEHEFLDFLFTDFAQGVWFYRREPSIVQSVTRMALATADGLRYLAPELVLLFKSRNTGTRDRSKDQLDFAHVLPALEAHRRAWLRWALLVTNPEHPWLARLDR